MLGRRTKAIVEFVGASFGLAYYWWRNRDRRPAWRWVLAGALLQAAYLALYDRDAGGIRTKWYRRLGPGVVIGTALTLVKFLVGESVQEDVVLGIELGTIVYRFKYGVLGPVPGE